MNEAIRKTAFSVKKAQKKYRYKNTWDYDPKRYYEIRDVYERQLIKFEMLGIGGVTEFGTTVTQTLIDVTKKRKKELDVLTRRNNKKNIAMAKEIEEKFSIPKTKIKEVA